MKRILFLLSLFPLFLSLPGRAGEPPPGTAIRFNARVLLEQLFAEAEARHPVLAAQREHVRRYQSERDAVSGFYDPQATLAFGHREEDSAVPGTPVTQRLSSESWSAQGGISAPFSPGATLHLGLSEHYRNDLDDPGIESRVGARISVPLLRDRGFREQSLRGDLADTTLAEAVFHYQTLRQDLRRDVDHAFIRWVQAHDNLAAVNDALDRMNRLLEETRQRVALTVTAEYQLFTAEMEVAMRHEERLRSEAEVAAAVQQIAEILGGSIPREFFASAPDLAQWAAEALHADPIVTDMDRACRMRAVYQEALTRHQAAIIDLQSAEEARRDRLDLELGAAWHDTLESSHNGMTPDRKDQSRFGFEAVVTWRRPLGRRAENAAITIRHSMRESRIEELRAVRLRIETEIELARIALESARQRLAMSTKAVSEARKAMDAEQQRFQMGEGRSRNVLDAQKDLTTAIRLKTSADGDLLRALSDLTYATGHNVPSLDPPQPSAP